MNYPLPYIQKLWSVILNRHPDEFVSTSGVFPESPGIPGQYVEFSGEQSIVGRDKNSAFNVSFEDDVNNIQMDGVASYGTSGRVIMSDHRHPTDTSLSTQNSVLKDPTGFDSSNLVLLTYNSTTRKITLTGAFSAYYRGLKVDALTTGWVSEAHADVVGTYYLRYNGSAFVFDTNVWSFQDIQIAFVNYGATDKYGLRDCHGLNLFWSVHGVLHDTIGTYRESGGALSGHTLSSTTVAHRRPSVTDCEIHDEDCKTVNIGIAAGGPYTQLFLTAAGITDFTIDAADIIPLLTNNPYYNKYTTSWGQVLMPANSVATVWLLEVPASTDATSQKYRHIWIQPQWITQASGAGAPSLATARAAEALRSPSELNLGTFGTNAPEYVVVARVTVQYTASNWTIEAVSVVTGSKFSQISAPTGAFISSLTGEVTAGVDGVSTVSEATLVALKNMDSTPGVVVETAEDAFTKRTLTGTTNRVTITQGAGISGNPTFDCGSDIIDKTTAGQISGITNKAIPVGGDVALIEDSASSWAKKYATFNDILSLLVGPFLFGDGSDGDVTVTGALSLSRTMYYNNLTLGAGCAIALNGFRIYVKGILDISSAPSNSITTTSNPGGNGGTPTAGTAPAAQLGNTIPGAMNGTAGGAGSTGAGAQAPAQTAQTHMGGSAGAGGKGGDGEFGGVGGASRSPAAHALSQRNYITEIFCRYGTGTLSLILGGGAGVGGSGGGGGTFLGLPTYNGGGGGGGGNSGLPIAIHARKIQRGTNVNTGIIKSVGGNGGVGGNSQASGNTGGGGGGSGGGGGYVYFIYEQLLGSIITGAINVGGGNGGNGGNKNGTGTVGDGGYGGAKGSVILINTGAGAITYYSPGSAVANSGQTGGTGQAGLVDL